MSRRIESGSGQLGPGQICSILSEYLRPLPSGIEFSVQKYMNLLNVWNGRIPLTSVRSPEQIVRFHFGESLFAAPLIWFSNGRLADLGSGSGFPGLALKLAEPALEVTLIESNQRKCAFLHEVVRELGLSGVDVMASRFEDAQIRSRPLQFMTSRALGGDREILGWAKDKLGESGNVILWLGEDRLRSLMDEHAWRWSEPLLIPNSRKRFIISGRFVGQ
jgi:16S rRNA (guanine527-N7)-methyltransferase